jgi:chemotaxis protein methyltransferase CheR
MIRDEEVQVLLSDLLDIYGYDFNEYSKASLRRRIGRLYELDRFPSFAEFRFRIKSDEDYLKRFVEEVTVNVTEMFRDPHFYEVLRKEVLPVLATYPLIRIWHAGCSTGEEVFSMAILLSEANLLHKSLLYATDLNPDVLEKAKSGIFPLSVMKHYSENYIMSGGKKDFSSYYSSGYEFAIFDRQLSSRMIFATHNLVSDRSFNEFQLIMCRNVLIYFEKELQERVLALFDQSIEQLGFLALGSKETLRFSPLAASYKQLGKEKIWRKGV